MPRISLKERYRQVLARFAAEMPEPKTELHYDTPFHLLLAVILSAQCTDKRVNMVTPLLFEAFPDAASLAASDEETVYGYIRSVSYPNNKTKSLLGAARKLTEEFGGEVPDNIDDLLTIPGVGRKTANVMLQDPEADRGGAGEQHPRGADTAGPPLADSPRTLRLQGAPPRLPELRHQGMVQALHRGHA